MTITLKLADMYNYCAHRVFHAELPTLADFQTFCLLSVWTPPAGRFDTFSGYDIRYFIPGGQETILQAGGSEFFRLTSAEVFAMGPQQQIMVQVRKNHD